MAEMSPTRRRAAILIVVVGSALLAERVASLAFDDSGDSVAISEPTGARRAVHAADLETGAVAEKGETRVQLERLAQRMAASPQGAASASAAALFKTVSWLPVAPKVAPPPPPKPVAPPFPYPYMGGLTEDGVRTAFFTKGNRVLPVKAGDTIDGAFRIDQMTEDHMTVTYLPLGDAQVVAFGNKP